MRKEELLQEDKLIAKAEILRKLRRRDLVRDTKRSSIRRSIEYKPPKMNVLEYLVSSSETKLPNNFDETAKEVHSYRVALENSQKVMKQL